MRNVAALCWFGKISGVVVSDRSEHAQSVSGKIEGMTKSFVTDWNLSKPKAN